MSSNPYRTMRRKISELRVELSRVTKLAVELGIENERLQKALYRDRQALAGIVWDEEIEDPKQFAFTYLQAVQELESLERRQVEDGLVKTEERGTIDAGQAPFDGTMQILDSAADLPEHDRGLVQDRSTSQDENHDALQGEAPPDGRPQVLR